MPRQPTPVLRASKPLRRASRAAAAWLAPRGPRPPPTRRQTHKPPAARTCWPHHSTCGGLRGDGRECGAAHEGEQTSQPGKPNPSRPRGPLPHLEAIHHIIQAPLLQLLVQSGASRAPFTAFQRLRRRHCDTYVRIMQFGLVSIDCINNRTARDAVCSAFVGLGEPRGSRDPPGRSPPEAKYPAAARVIAIYGIRKAERRVTRV